MTARGKPDGVAVAADQKKTPCMVSANNGAVDLERLPRDVPACPGDMAYDLATNGAAKDLKMLVGDAPCGGPLVPA